MRISVLITAGSLALMLSACGRRSVQPQNIREALFSAQKSSLSDEPDSEATQWRVALEPRLFDFPRDHGAHEDYQIEWWYYTGNLEDDFGRDFGYQLTFFRTGVRRRPNNPSRWAIRDLYTVHFAISDVPNRRHYAVQRNNREGVGWAGAATDRYRVWNGTAKVWLEGDTHRLVAKELGYAIDLCLRSSKPLALHGEKGLSRKGPAPGNASYYYSFTRLFTEGTITIQGQTIAVKGHSWMDHEFSSSFLEKGQVGWDWFAIQLDNDVEIMVYQIRRDDGLPDALSSGSLVGRDGEVTYLAKSVFVLEPLSSWSSPQTGAVYPVHWRIELPELGYRLRVRPAFNQQEMTTGDTTGIKYWEGSIYVEGRSKEGPTKGRGYLEMTGYTGQGLGSLFDRQVTKNSCTAIPAISPFLVSAPIGTFGR